MMPIKAKGHLDEVTVLEKELEEWWETITTAAHSRSVRAAAAIATPPAAARCPPPPHVEGTGNMKLVGELKPETLQHDSMYGYVMCMSSLIPVYMCVSRTCVHECVCTSVCIDLNIRSQYSTRTRRMCIIEHGTFC